MNAKHYLLLSLPFQSHIHPTLQLAKILTRLGARVTLATTTAGLSRLNALPTIHGLSYSTFSDGSEQNTDDSTDDDKSKKTQDYMSNLRRVGPISLTNLINQLSTDGSPVSFIVYTMVLPWAAEVARDMHIPSAFLFIQCAIVFAILHRFFNTNDGLHADNDDFGHEVSIELPKLPLFTAHDIPSFLLPGDENHSALVPIFREHMQTLEKDTNPCVLVNTFHALEEDYMYLYPNINFIPIGPLLPSAISDKNDLHDKSFGGHMFETSKTNYLSWLDSKPDKSVIYVSFGSIMVLKQAQKEEIVLGLMTSKKPFLWVIREITNEDLLAMQEKYGISEEVGLIVPWCSQVEVLSHRATGCFVTHCGWNSTLESIACGVPVVGCPCFSDQTTNMRIVEELWGNGVRVKDNEEGVFVREEISKCLDIVMGEDDREGKEIKENALKWKSLAIEAVQEGGSSHNSLLHFLEM